MTTETLLLLVVILLLIGAFPAWPYSRTWGYAPVGLLTVLLVVFIVWAVAGERPLFRSAGNDVQDVVQEGADSLKDLTRDAGDAVRRTVD